jgi:hypothetical protein
LWTVFSPSSKPVHRGLGPVEQLDVGVVEELLVGRGEPLDAPRLRDGVDDLAPVPVEEDRVLRLLVDLAGDEHPVVDVVERDGQRGEVLGDGLLAGAELGDGGPKAAELLVGPVRVDEPLAVLRQ